ncbi:cation diffusion facilitator family transporter [Lysinibacillus sp. AR18-8]|uniref:cation diffusion facilitator family transporter n=1 Tax=Lysinibacillus sp. AR18-8 TaxID=1889781 RepID=UPI000825EDDB|nr:cation diffusion facilitator family transporter [Lysinibacillus sp. AR18-8]OCX63337.1 cation diffusion facilitator family transporter [Lysinibacillus sp. AR18-8]
MAKENAIFGKEEEINEELTESFNFDELEEKLQSQLEEELADMQFLAEEKEKIGNPENLGSVIKDVIWEQFTNQIAVVAGEDFIKENNGLTLDLRNEAHIQTPENFAKGNIATHNYKSKEQLEQNYDRFKNTPHKEFRDNYVDPGMNATLKRAGNLKKEGIDTVTDIYTGRQIPTDTKLENGQHNPKAAQREHVKPSAEVYKNPSLQMANSDKELADIINNPENLQGYTTAERNNRKSDKSSGEMSENDKNKHWEKADKKAEEYIKQKEKEGEDRLKKEGRKTQKEEAFRIGGKALRAVLMQLLAEFVREIIAKLVKWFKSAKKSLDSLLNSLKEAIHLFIGKMKTHMINAGNTVFSTIATAIIGPVFGTIKKVWMLLKQGWGSLKSAVKYIKDPANKGKPVSTLMMEVGKIIMAGLTGAGALLLGEVIEKGLMAIPIFAFEIPLLGSLANILGIFLGAVVAGIIGAIAINLLDKLIAKKQKEEVQEATINKGNKALSIQAQQKIISEAKLEDDKTKVQSNILNRHHDAAEIMAESFTNIMEDFVNIPSSNDNDVLVIDKKDVEINGVIGEVSDDLDKLLNDL